MCGFEAAEVLVRGLNRQPPFEDRHGLRELIPREDSEEKFA